MYRAHCSVISAIAQLSCINRLCSCVINETVRITRKTYGHVTIFPSVVCCLSLRLYSAKVAVMLKQEGDRATRKHAKDSGNGRGNDNLG